MKKLKINPRRYEDLWDQINVKKIRNYLNPKIWMPNSVTNRTLDNY